MFRLHRIQRDFTCFHQRQLIADSLGHHLSNFLRIHKLLLLGIWIGGDGFAWMQEVIRRLITALSTKRLGLWSDLWRSIQPRVKNLQFLSWIPQVSLRYVERMWIVKQSANWDFYFRWWRRLFLPRDTGDSYFSVSRRRVQRMDICLFNFLFACFLRRCSIFSSKLT